MSTVAPSAIVRRAGIPDASAVLVFAKRFVDRSPFARFVDYSEDAARTMLLQCLDRGAVFVLEIPGVHREHEPMPPPKIVGALMGTLTPLWFSKEMIACELGWWVDEDHRGSGNTLRLRFEAWARQVRAPVVCMSDVVMDNSTPAGELYQRAGYDCVERAWMKGLR